ncbi:Methyltransferase domain-containing protein [Paractinoplanes atraurantiacus]|uniref:Methyltransferase domain-containing protein n=1 Tax=Paractinoplanes atraurantiacus TaxID=1036182 RepID=A0A285FVJ7_9ACTN|nr:Methyltransferase domain-containing protein [Actinoplanes atraurantiacus]
MWATKEIIRRRLRRRARRYANRLTSLSRRQWAGVAVVLTGSAGVAVAAAIDQAAVATCLLALLLAAVLAGVIHLSRRIGRVNRSTQAAVRDLRTVVDELQRRVLAAVEKERLAAGDRHQELTESLARAERLTGRGAELLLREQSREIEALVQLFQWITPRAPMPAGVTLNPSDLLGLVHIARDRAPATTVALGSGPSTIWLGYTVEARGGRLVVADHDRGRAGRTRALLAEHGLSTVEVRHAGVTELSVEGGAVDWYDVDALDGLHDIDLLVVDGSLAPTSSNALTPALHVLGRRLAPGAVVVVDESPVPRQGGFGLTAQRPLPGRWVALADPQSTVRA